MRKSVLILIALLFAVSVFAGNENGAPEMKLDAGSKPGVYFPHQMHQTILKDCNACHDLFEKKPGVIQDSITQGKLKKKQVMNKKCVSCHKVKKRAGEDHGPTSCSACHKK